MKELSSMPTGSNLNFWGLGAFTSYVDKVFGFFLKTVNFYLKVYFWGQNRLKQERLISCARATSSSQSISIALLKCITLMDGSKVI